MNITYPDLDKSVELTGQSYKWLETELPEFTAGEYKIIIKGTSGTLTDTITKKTTFHLSYRRTAVSEFNALTDQTKLTVGPLGQADVLFTNQERGRYYRDIQGLNWESGDRLDQKIARNYSQVLLNNYFGKQAIPENFIFDNFQIAEGGISLLPYSSADLLFTAKVMEIDSENFDTIGVQSYFESALNNKNSNQDEITYSLFGLANLGQPVLTEITNFLNAGELAPELQLYLARGLANLGAGEYAKTILEEIMAKYGDDVDPYKRLLISDDHDAITEFTWQAAILAAGTSLPEAVDFYSYAAANPADKALNFLDQLIYLKVALPLLSSQPVSFSYILDGQETNVTLKNNETHALAINSKNADKITFKQVTGQIGLVTTFEKLIAPTEITADPDVNISRKYTVNAKTTTSFNTGDIVKIELTPQISNRAGDNEYQITDYLPAGLKIITKTYNRNIAYDQRQRYPYEINGVQAKFWSGKPSTTFIYYAMAAEKGEYRAEPPLIQGFISKESQAYGNVSTQVTVK